MNQTDIFLCYRRPGAQTAKLFKRYLLRRNLPADVWYSDEEIYGNFREDIPSLLQSACCAVLFIDPAFTRDFDDPKCITAVEVQAIAARLLETADFRLITVFLDRPTGFTPEEQAELRRLFAQSELDADRALERFSLSNRCGFRTAVDVEEELFSLIAENLLPPRYFRSRFAQGNFYFGQRPTQVDVAVWDTERGIRPEDVTFCAAEGTPPLYERIRRMRCDLSDVRQNNQMVSLYRLVTTLTDNEERKQLEVFYQDVDYRLFAQTLRLWDAPRLNLGQTLACYSCDSPDPYPIPNAMGLAFFVVTADRQLLFTRRSSARGIRPGEYDCSVVEGLLQFVDTPQEHYDLFEPDYLEREIHRAYREELCPDDRELTIRLCGVVLDRQYGQWNFIATVFTPDTAEGILQKHAVRNDTYEQNSLHAVPLTQNGQPSLAPVRAFLAACRGNMWDMAYAALYAALRAAGFSEQACQFDASV